MDARSCVPCIAIDDAHWRVTINGQEEVLTPVERALFVALVRARGRILSWQLLALASHGYVIDRWEAKALLEKHLFNLRRKVRPHGVVIQNRRTAGFWLDARLVSDA